MNLHRTRFGGVSRDIELYRLLQCDVTWKRLRNTGVLNEIFHN